MTQHTKEPWVLRLFQKGAFSIEEKDSVLVICQRNSMPDDMVEEGEANAVRIVACVNAMAGIKDPEVFIKMARDALDIK